MYRPLRNPEDLVGTAMVLAPDASAYVTGQDTGDGSRCDPFTITEAHGPYLIRCHIVSWMDLI
jgi:hypothetical protein